jgi:drug/metabolite transporter superfamily protein YnfA
MMRSPARRPRLGLLVSWFVAFWVAGVRPSLAALLAAWTVYAALSERPQVGREWAAFGGVLTLLFAFLAVQARL